MRHPPHRPSPVKDRTSFPRIDRPRRHRLERRAVMVLLLVWSVLIGVSLEYALIDDRSFEDRGLRIAPVADGSATWNRWLEDWYESALPLPALPGDGDHLHGLAHLPRNWLEEEGPPGWTAVMREYFRRSPNVLELGAESTDAPSCWSHHRTAGSRDATSQLLATSKLLEYRAALQVHDHDAAGAFRTIDDGLRFTDRLWSACPPIEANTGLVLLHANMSFRAYNLLAEGRIPPEIERRWLRPSWIERNHPRIVEEYYAATFTWLEQEFDFWLDEAHNDAPAWLRGGVFRKRNRTLGSLADEYRFVIPLVAREPFARPSGGSTALAHPPDRASIVRLNYGEYAVADLLSYVPGELSLLDTMLRDARILRTVVAIHAHERRFGELPVALYRLPETVEGLGPTPLDPRTGAPFEFDRERRVLVVRSAGATGATFEVEIPPLPRSG